MHWSVMAGGRLSSRDTEKRQGMLCRIGRRWYEKAGRQRCCRPQGSHILVIKMSLPPGRCSLSQIAGLAGEVWPGFPVPLSPGQSTQLYAVALAAEAGGGLDPGGGGACRMSKEFCP